MLKQASDLLAALGQYGTDPQLTIVRAEDGSLCIIAVANDRAGNSIQTPMHFTPAEVAGCTDRQARIAIERLHASALAETKAAVTAEDVTARLRDAAKAPKELWAGSLLLAQG